MSRKIKVKKSLGKGKPLIKIERNENIATQIPLHAILTDPPHTPTVITAEITKVKQYYTEHLTGNKEATIKMYTHLDILDGFYYDTAEYVEKIANENDDTSLPTSMGFEVYAEKKPRAKKGLSIRDGNHAGEVFVEYPKLEDAAVYRAEIAEVIEGREPDFDHAGACSITFRVLQNLKPNTKYLIRLNGIFASGEGPTSDPVPFRTKEWPQ